MGSMGSRGLGPLSADVGVFTNHQSWGCGHFAHLAPLRPLRETTNNKPQTTNTQTTNNKQQTTNHKPQTLKYKCQNTS